MTGLSQQELARLAARVAAERDREAFTRLYDHFAPRINAYLQRLGLEPARAEELTQDVMVALWHKAGLYDAQKSSLATWLFRIARNRRIDAVRRDRWHLVDQQDPFFQPEQAVGAGEDLDARRREERVRAAAQALPAEQRELVRAAFFLGLTHSQIAVQAGLPLGTVKSRIRLAFARLRRELEADPLVDVD